MMALSSHLLDRDDNTSQTINKDQKFGARFIFIFSLNCPGEHDQEGHLKFAF